MSSEITQRAPASLCASYLGRGGEEHACPHTLGQAEHVERAHGGGLDGLDGVVLVVGRRGRAGQMVDLVHLAGR